MGGDMTMAVCCCVVVLHSQMALWGICSLEAKELGCNSGAQETRHQ